MYVLGAGEQPMYGWMRKQCVLFVENTNLNILIVFFVWWYLIAMSY